MDWKAFLEEWDPGILLLAGVPVPVVLVVVAVLKLSVLLKKDPGPILKMLHEPRVAGPVGSGPIFFTGAVPFW